MTTTEHIGSLIQQRRIAIGLTQETLAAACEVGPRFIRELEKGKSTCQIGKVLKVMQKLGLEVTVTVPRDIF